MLIFQAIYDWATVPMDLIDTTFASLAEWTKKALPNGGMLTDLLAEGIVSGIGGVVIFIPQIAFSYLYRFLKRVAIRAVVFLMDRIMRRFGISGKM